MLNKEEVFAIETVTMAILLSVAGWASVEIFEIKEAIAHIQTEQIKHNMAVDTLEEVRVTLARVEEGQKYLHFGIETTGKEVKDLSNHVREIHTKK